MRAQVQRCRSSRRAAPWTASSSCLRTCEVLGGSCDRECRVELGQQVGWCWRWSISWSCCEGSPHRSAIPWTRCSRLAFAGCFAPFWPCWGRRLTRDRWAASLGCSEETSGQSLSLQFPSKGICTPWLFRLDNLPSLPTRSAQRWKHTNSHRKQPQGPQASLFPPLPPACIPPTLPSPICAGSAL